MNRRDRYVASRLLGALAAITLGTAAYAVAADDGTNVGSESSGRAVMTTATTASLWRSAIANDNAVELAQLLTRDEDSMLRTTLADNGKSALMVACKVGNLALAKRLIAAGSEIDAVTLTGGTAFMFAVLGDRLKIARWLHRRGAALDNRGSNGWSAVTIASAKGLDDMLDWLIEAGADPDRADVYGFTPLMRAADNAHEQSVRRLLAEAVEVDAVDERGNSALHHAVAGNRAGIASLLVAHGANVDLKNRDGLTPTDLGGAPVRELR